MSTAEEGGATANTTTSSYGGGGAGGKLWKKPFRRPTTPYDRPPTALGANSTNGDNCSSWLTNFVLGTASKLLSYGAAVYSLLFFADASLRPHRCRLSLQESKLLEIVMGIEEKALITREVNKNPEVVNAACQ